MQRFPQMTLRNLGDFSLEAIANETLARLLEQGRPSYDGSKCLYRSDDGAKCAVGLLMSDADFRPGHEGATAGGLVHFLDLDIDEGREHLLVVLQEVHDCAARRGHHHPGDFPGALSAAAAQTYGPPEHRALIRDTLRRLSHEMRA